MTRRQRRHARLCAAALAILIDNALIMTTHICAPHAQMKHIKARTSMCPRLRMESAGVRSVHVEFDMFKNFVMSSSAHLGVAALADGEHRSAARCAALVLLVLEALLEAREAVAVGAVLGPHGVFAHLCR